ncbi:TPA: hypothetical protein TZR38_001263 [Streptococcus suis]|nr:hypothetical protein [Streptococcus suis]HEL2373451.1 hypothetical protein [Streptococcus suis]
MNKKELLKRIEKIRISSGIDTPKIIFADNERPGEISEKLDLPPGSVIFCGESFIED